MHVDMRTYSREYAFMLERFLIAASTSCRQTRRGVAFPINLACTSMRDFFHTGEPNSRAAADSLILEQQLSFRSRSGEHLASSTRVKPAFPGSNTRSVLENRLTKTERLLSINNRCILSAPQSSRFNRIKAKIQEVQIYQTKPDTPCIVRGKAVNYPRISKPRSYSKLPTGEEICICSQLLLRRERRQRATQRNYAVMRRGHRQTSPNGSSRSSISVKERAMAGDYTTAEQEAPPIPAVFGETDSMVFRIQNKTNPKGSGRGGEGAVAAGNVRQKSSIPPLAGAPPPPYLYSSTW